jgi:hypothetical protein
VSADSLERIAHDAAVRALDKQERVLDELRARTGVLLAASALAASFLGDAGFARSVPPSLLAALIACAATIAASVFILVPRRHQFVFGVAGAEVFAWLYDAKDDVGEMHRRLVYELQRLWEANDARLQPLFRAYRFAAGMLVVEVLALLAVATRTMS